MNFKNMSLLNFTYNISKDTENYLNAVYRFKYLKHQRKNIEQQVTHYLSDKDVLAIKKSKTKKEVREVIYKIITKWLKFNQDILELNAQILSKAWQRREKQFIKYCENFFEKPFDFDDITCYFTTLPICPYHYPLWFMNSIKFSVEEQLLTIYHELFHFMFIKYYQDYCFKKGLSKEEFEIIKEALTVFLNQPPFTKINTIPEKGYPLEKSLRDFMLKGYRKNLGFKKFLDNSIKYLKNNSNKI